MDNQKIQEHVQTVREAIEKATNYEFFSDISQHYPDDPSAHLIANSPTWHQQSIDIIEQQQREIERLRSGLTEAIDDFNIIIGLKNIPFEVEGWAEGAIRDINIYLEEDTNG